MVSDESMSRTKLTLLRTQIRPSGSSFSSAAIWVSTPSAKLASARRPNSSEADLTIMSRPRRLALIVRICSKLRIAAVSAVTSRTWVSSDLVL